jgi:RNA polymerase sigma factor (sigma-70 family)
MSEIPVTSASLLVRLRDAHDEAAWSEFVHLYAPLVYGYARKQGLQDADAADICQEVLGAVANGVGRLDYDPARGAFRNWLFTIVRRRIADWRLARERQPAGSGDSSTHQVLDEIAAAAETDAWEQEWEQRLFLWACAQVRPEVSASTWQAFWRTAVEGERGKLVAADLGLSVAAVYHARSRVRARLIELIRTASSWEAQ